MIRLGGGISPLRLVHSSGRFPQPPRSLTRGGPFAPLRSLAFAEMVSQPQGAAGVLLVEPRGERFENRGRGHPAGAR